MTFGEWALLLATWLVAGLLLGLAYHRVRTRDRLARMAHAEDMRRQQQYVMWRNPGFFPSGGFRTDAEVRREYARLLFEESEESDRQARLDRLKARAGR